MRFLQFEGIEVMWLMAYGDFRTSSYIRQRNYVQMDGAFLEEMLYLGIGTTGSTHKSGLVAICSSVHTYFGTF